MSLLNPPFPTWELQPNPVKCLDGTIKFSEAHIVGDPFTIEYNGGFQLFVSIGEYGLGPSIHSTWMPEPGGPFIDTKFRNGEWPRRILSPKDPEAIHYGDTFRCETFSCAWDSNRSRAVGLYIGSPGLDGQIPTHDHHRLFMATARSIGSLEWTRVGSVLGRDKRWELGWVDIQGKQQGSFGEGSLHFYNKILITTYAARSVEGWSIGLAYSPDGGYTWIKYKKNPIITPDTIHGRTFTSQPNLKQLSNGWWLLTFTVGFNKSPAQGQHEVNGIAQAMTLDPYNGPWTEDPRGVLITNSDAGIIGNIPGNIGSPSVTERDGQLFMHFHKKYPNSLKTGPKQISEVRWAAAKLEK